MGQVSREAAEANGRLGYLDLCTPVGESTVLSAYKERNDKAHT